MSEAANNETLTARLSARLGQRATRIVEALGETTLEVVNGDLLETARLLRDEFGFEQLIDVCGVDYLGYGAGEWDVSDVSSEGFSRAVEGTSGPGRFRWENRSESADYTRRFAAVIHVLSV